MFFYMFWLGFSLPRNKPTLGLLIQRSFSISLDISQTSIAGPGAAGSTLTVVNSEVRNSFVGVLIYLSCSCNNRVELMTYFRLESNCDQGNE